MVYGDVEGYKTEEQREEKAYLIQDKVNVTEEEDLEEEILILNDSIDENDPNIIQKVQKRLDNQLTAQLEHDIN